MQRALWLGLAMIVIGPCAGLAQQPLAQQAPASAALNDKELLGMRLFNQSCRLCHTKPQLTSPLYGPVLSRQSLGGQDNVMREVISNGTPRMPGFKHHFEQPEIDAIVAYLKTIPAPAP
jgi:mono/diheme cytochrome c family protein